jgi:hypothetical protein
MADQPENILLRFIVDAVVPADSVPGEHRLNRMAGELSENLHVAIAEDSDELNMKIEDKYSHVHVHDATENQCRACAYHAFDEKNGDLVVENSSIS